MSKELLFEKLSHSGWEIKKSATGSISGKYNRFRITDKETRCHITCVSIDFNGEECPNGEEISLKYNSNLKTQINLINAFMEYCHCI